MGEQGVCYDEYMRLQIFSGASLDALRPVLKECPVRKLEPGEVLLAPGGRNTTLFVLVSGRLSVQLRSLEDEPLTHIEYGECVGELSVVSGGTVTAFVVATEPSRLLAISQNLLWKLLDASYIVARNLLLILSMRVRLSNTAILDAESRKQVFEQYARSDTLTGVFNRRHLDELMERMACDLASGGRGFSMILLDIDHFKRYNDTHGHLGGDSVLAAIGRQLDTGVRVVDTVTRYGGEEFAIVLPDIDAEGAAEIAERILSGVRSMKVIHCDGSVLPPVTISAGVSAAIPGQSPTEIIASADKALYRAKEDGRDRICVAD